MEIALAVRSLPGPARGFVDWPSETVFLDATLAGGERLPVAPFRLARVESELNLGNNVTMGSFDGFTAEPDWVLPMPDQGSRRVSDSAFRRGSRLLTGDRAQFENRFPATAGGGCTSC